MNIRNKQNIQRKKEINTLPTIMNTIVYLILKLRGPLKKKVNVCYWIYMKNETINSM